MELILDEVSEERKEKENSNIVVSSCDALSGWRRLLSVGTWPA